MSYLTHGRRRPKRSVVVGEYLAVGVLVFGPLICFGLAAYLLFEWLT